MARTDRRKVGLRNYSSTSETKRESTTVEAKSDSYTNKEDDIRRFSSIAMGKNDKKNAVDVIDNSQYVNDSMVDFDDSEEIFEFFAVCGRWLCCLNDSLYEWYISIVKEYLIDPDKPEFTPIQLHIWAVFLGVLMGAFTAIWGKIVHKGIHAIWIEVPEYLVEEGYFTELDGYFPLVHYMWIMPTIAGCVLSYICAIMTPMPGQNEWIDGVHTTGILDWKTLLHILIISTLGMISGLSLGPELPLVLMAGMIGSKLGIETKQSVLRARVLNLTCAAAAIGGFFRFPMAGALFILEIPHRFGLQYFEALSPATLASIMAVIVNRFVSGDEVTGYFTYPFLTETLPPHVFFMAILYGVLGSLSGVMYARLCLKLKGDVHHWFHEPHDDHHEDNNNHEESIPLVGTPGLLASSAKKVKRFQCYIKGEPRRAAFAGTIAGFIVGVICMFLPHLLFWGEGQLQTLIDRGHTPLPFFGRDGKPTEDLTAWGYCMDEELRGGNSLACYGIISVGKVVVTGLSLGTGIMGGHFWGPLYTGAAAAWFFHYFFEQFFPFFPALSEFPCVGILCIMGATHVVTYRAHTAIMLVLTLTIKNFLSEDDTGTQAGDFAAIFPLLVVACYVSLILTQNVIFYKEQRERTDIVAVPEVLCEPNKEGNPVFPVHSVEEFSDEDDSTDCESVEEIAPPPVFKPPTKPPRRFHRKSMSMDADFGKMNLGSLEIRQRLDSTGSTGSGSRTTPNKLERINSFGKVSPHHGSLMGQGTERRSHHRVSSYGSNSSGPMRKSLSRSSSIASSQNGSDSVDIFAAATAGLDLSKI